MANILLNGSLGEILALLLVLGWAWRITTQSGTPPDPPVSR